MIVGKVDDFASAVYIYSLYVTRVGFDLVGHEDSLKPLIDYLGPLLKFRRRQEELGIEIPFVFHAGETAGDGTKADLNLYDAILLGTKRIGHGYVLYFELRVEVCSRSTIRCSFSLYKHPKLLQLCRERGIAVEACPIS